MKDQGIFKLVKNSNKEIESTVCESSTKEVNEKNIFNNQIFINLIPQIILIVFAFVINRLWFRRKEKIEIGKLKTETQKLETEVNKLKKSFQPIVFSTLQKTQDKLLDEKLFVLKEIIKIKGRLYEADIEYENGYTSYCTQDDYYEACCRDLDESIILNLEKDILPKAYLFSDDILEKIITVKTSLKSIINEFDKECSKHYNEPSDSHRSFYKSYESDVSQNQINNLNQANITMAQIINLIREDLHLNDEFIHRFIKENKEIL